MTEPVGEVQLVITADPRQVRLARLIAGGFGSLAGLDVDALDDLRIAVDEVCTWLIEHGDGSGIDLSLAMVDGAVEVRGTTTASPIRQETDDTRSELALQILKVAVQTFEVKRTDDRVEFWFRAHPAGA